MAQFIYQMHGMFEMHFFAFIGSAILIAYQDWKLQIPITLFVVVHHAAFAYLQFMGFEEVYFTQLEYMNMQTFAIHAVLAGIVFSLCGLWAYNFKKSSLSQVRQSFKIGRLQEKDKQKEALLMERKLAEETISKSEKQYRQIVETAQEGIWMLDENSRTIFVNKKMSEILEYQPEEMLGKTNFDFMDEEAKLFAKKAIERRKQGVKENFELSFVSKSGKTVWTNLSTNPILDEQGNYKGALAMVTDITEKKLADEKIIHTERLLSEAQQLAKVGNWNVDIAQNEIFWSEGLRNIKGVGMDFEPSFEAFVAMIHPEDKERVVGEIMRLKNSEDFLENRYRIVRSDTKEVRVIHSIIRTMKDKEGKLVRIYGMSQDITELKNAQDDLENTLKELEQRVEVRTRELFISKELFSKTLESLGDAVISTDDKGTIVFMNSSAESITGRRLEEAKGKSIEFACVMINEATGRPIDNPVNISLKENKVVSLNETTLLYRNDGTFHYIDHNAAPIHNDKNEIVGAVLIFRDITEKAINLKKLKAAHREIEERNRSTTDSILYSKRIQEATLPRRESFSKLCPESFILYKPKDIVSGDFYWLAKEDNKLIIAVADCTGHGVPGAFMSIIGCSLLNEIVYRNKITKPSDILKKLNSRVRRFLKSDKLESQTQDGMDIAICCIDTLKNKMEFSGANRPLIHFSGDGLEIIKGNRYGVGGIQLESDREYHNHEIYFNREDRIYMFTDGYGDQFGGMKEKKMMSSKVIDLIKTNQPLHMHEQQQILDQNFEEWKGDLEQTDDVLLLGVKLDIAYQE
jgi:PAS domain S-box-containing protein